MKRTTIYLSLLAAFSLAISSCAKGCKPGQKQDAAVEEAPAAKEEAKEQALAVPETEKTEGAHDLVKDKEDEPEEEE